MELGMITATQVLIILVLMAVGFVCAKIKLVTEAGVKQMTDLLIDFVTPCVLIEAYQKDFNMELARGLLLAAVFSVLIHVAAIAVANLCFKKEPTLRYRVNRYAAVYSNCGFMAIPLMQAVVPDGGVFFGTAYIAVFTIAYWTHGIYCYTEDFKRLSFKKILLSPGILGILAALVLFVCQIRLPYVLSEGVRYMAALNTPLAMVILGTYLVDLDLKSALRNAGIYGVAALRLLVVPCIAVLLAWAMRLDETVATALLLPAACPVAAMATLFAARYDMDAAYASELVSFTTLFSIVTIPAVMLLYGFLK